MTNNLRKRSIKPKEPIKIRFKELASGGKSIYLDYYMDGKRSYEFLKLYLIPEFSESDKEQNKSTLQAANTIKAQRIIELVNGQAGLNSLSVHSNMLLNDYLKDFILKKKAKGQKSWRRFVDVAAVLKAYGGKNLKMKDINKDFLIGFIDFLRRKYISKRGCKHLTDSTVTLYVLMFNTVINSAVRQGVMRSNPYHQLESDERVKQHESKRCYLTIEEVKDLIKTPCSNEILKRAFLFSCFCGLRVSDISSLKWSEVSISRGRLVITKVIQKTGKQLNLPLSKEAAKWMPEREGNDEESAVFSIPSNSTIQRQLRKWAADAHIKKDITFHVARHTFATMMLTLGTDIYTTSKILGHSNVATTQVYAKIVDTKMAEAVDLVNKVFK